MTFHLRLRVEKIAFEELESYLERSRRRDRPEEPVRWYADLIGLDKGCHPNNITSLDIFRKLSDLTLLDVPSLVSMTFNRFISYFYPKEKSERLVLEQTGNIKTYKIDEFMKNRYLYGRKQNPRVCPLCIADKEAFLLPWAIRFITTCPFHKIQLLDCCPYCQTKINFYKRNRCEKCGSAINKFVAKSLDRAGEELSAITWNAIGCDYPTNNFPLIPTDSPISSITSDKLIHLFWTLGQHLYIYKYYEEYNQFPEDRRRGSIQSLLINDLHPIYLGVLRSLTEWPDNWKLVCSRICEIESQRRDVGLYNDHRFPYFLNKFFKGTDWNWLIDPIREITYNSSSNKFEYWKRYFDKSTERLSKEIYLPKRILKNSSEFTAKAGSFVEPDQLSKEENILSFSQAAELIGITERGLREVLFAGMINIIDTDNEKNGKIDRRVKRQFSSVEIKSFLKKISRELPLIKLADLSEDTYIYFNDAKNGCRCKGVNFIEFLSSIFYKILPVYRTCDEGNLQTLIVLKTDFYEFHKDIDKLGGSLGASVYEVMKILSCGESTLKNLCKSGLLEPSNALDNFHNWRYSKDSIDEYQKKFVTTKDIPKILGISINQIKGLITNKLLLPVSGPGIDNLFFNFKLDTTRLKN